MNGITFKLLSVFALLMSVGTSKAQKWIPFDEQGGGKTLSTEIIKSAPTEYRVKVTIHGLSDELVTNELGEFHRLSFGRYGYLSVIGDPSLPLFSQSIAIPKGATITAEITDKRWTDIEIGRVLPTQKPLLETEIAKGFDYNEEVYRSSYTPTLLNIGQIMQWRNIKNTAISVCPFKYYPQENRLSVMTEFVLHVNFTYGQEPNFNSFPNVDDPYCLFDNIPYTDVVSKQFQGGVETVRSGNDDYYNYLILVGEGLNFANSQAMKDFRVWKAKKGYKTNVASIDTIGFPSSSIRSFISQEYDKGVRYVLLVGDYNNIPLGEVYTSLNRDVISDYWYGCVRGDDVQADIAIGRFSVESYIDFRNMVDKTIKYESKYNSSNEVLLVAHAEGGSQYFQSCCEEIASSHNGQMTFQRAYGAGYPDGNNATNANVIDSINNGSHIVNYRGHGSPTFWGSLDGDSVYTWNCSGESFTVSEINNMNDETCAVFFSVACKTGRIEGETCMLEAFTRSNHGAVAFIGATENTNHDANDGYDKLLFNKLLNNNVYHLGDLNVSAHVSNITSTPESQDNPFCYLCGGDPTLELWTATPQNMTVYWNFENDYATIQTNLTGDYYITIASTNGECIDSIACSSSLVTFPIPALTKFYITVNKHNYYPHVIYYDSVTSEIVNHTFDYDAYYSASPLDVLTVEPLVEVGSKVKSGHTVKIKKGNDSVTIWDNFECEKGAKFEIK